jgi:hypothetical protein
MRAHIYKPAIYLMSTYVAHAVAWLLGIRHSGHVFLHPLKPNIPVPVPIPIPVPVPIPVPIPIPIPVPIPVPIPIRALVCMVCGVHRVPYMAPSCLCWLRCAGSSCRACIGLCVSRADGRGDMLHADSVGSASQSDGGG